jgi:dGTPase
MRTRKDIENLEDQVLAPYAMKSKDSAGRIYPERVQHVRTCYQRDRDRIIHSEAFRKLEYKTQVFVIFEGDYYRTRLTHTIEVAQIARTIGRSLRLNEDLIEAIALAHDLGHAPFGHAGEKTLDRILRQVNEKFDHNLHSFEIVTEHEKRYPDFDGLNLTEEVIVGILKHETNYDKAGRVARYKNKYPSLEAKVVDIADSLAYLSHDIDDGLTSGCITEDDLKENALWLKALKKIKKTANKKMMKYQIVKTLIDMQIRDLLATSFRQLKARDFQSSDQVKRFHAKHPHAPVIGFGEGMQTERNLLQNLLHEKLYTHYRVVRMTEKANRIINEIFHVYFQNPKQLPYNVYARDKRYSVKKKHKLICNYIASMTDRFALDEHKKLFNPYQKV